VVVAVLLLTATSACQLSQLQFRGDHRLAFTTPAARARISLPVQVAWSMRDFAASGLDGSSTSGRGVYAVFVDAAPMPVGKDIRWVARKDVSCRRDPRCPSAQYLADNGVYLTTDPSVTIDDLPRAPDGVGDEEHYVNVVLLDGRGRRTTESAWYRPFTMKRRVA
jgi:hypothetical protein